MRKEFASEKRVSARGLINEIKRGRVLIFCQMLELCVMLLTLLMPNAENAFPYDGLSLSDSIN